MSSRARDEMRRIVDAATAREGPRARLGIDRQQEPPIKGGFVRSLDFLVQKSRQARRAG